MDDSLFQGYWSLGLGPGPWAALGLEGFSGLLLAAVKAVGFTLNPKTLDPGFSVTGWAYRVVESRKKVGLGVVRANPVLVWALRIMVVNFHPETLP